MNTEKKIAFFVSTLGYRNNLLYWEPILAGFLKKFPTTRIITFGTESTIADTGYRVEKAITCFRIKKKLSNGFSNVLSLPSPMGLVELIKWNPDLVIASEFGIMTIYASIYRWLFYDSRLLLLVENDPKFMQGNRSSPFSIASRRWIGKQTDLIITNNAHGKHYLRETIGVSERKVKTACYLTSQLQLKPELITPHEDNKLKLLFVGQIIRRKGLYELLNALVKLPVVHLKNLEVSIVGDGCEKTELEKLTVNLGLTSVVYFYGSQPYEKVANFYAVSDVFILPTLKDYRALVGFEALSAGLPIIDSCYDGAASEVVIEGYNGFIVDPLKPESITEKIVWFLKNRSALTAFSEASRRLNKQYSWSNTITNLVNACHDCLEGRIK